MTDTYAAIGTSGLLQYNGRVAEEYLRELQGVRWQRVLREITSQDPTVGAALFAIEMLIRQVVFEVVPASDDPADHDTAEFIEACMSSMHGTWPETLAEILSFLPHGHVELEIVYAKRADGRIGWECWGVRSQETIDRWEFDDGGRAVGFWQIAPPKYQQTYIPLEKCLHLRTTSRKGNPEGRSVLRNAYRPWYFKQNIENVEGIGIERDLAGFPVVRIPAAVINKAGADYTAWKNVATNIRRDEQEGLVIPSDLYQGTSIPQYSVELLSTGGSRAFDTDAIIGRYNAQIAMSLLADFIVLGHEKVGSFALSSSKTELFGVALGAFLETICEGIKKQCFQRLLALNGIPAERCPTLQHGDIETADLGVLGTFVQQITGAGVAMTDPIARWLLEQAGIPVPAESEADDASEPPEPPQTGEQDA